MNGHSFYNIRKRTLGMKNIGNIFKTDMKNIGTNWVAAILIGGLILLPSLYAWVNIKAMWDPYSQTDQIPVGIVNEDAGAMVRDKEIHAGDELVDNIKENNDMNWKFVDREKAIDKVGYGDYFAVIVIPEDFSESLGTVIDDDPEKANVEYYVNEKLNAIVPKITEKGASSIVQQISSEFISTVNGVIFDIFNELGIEIEENLPDIEQFEEYIFEVEDKLPEINKILNESLTDATNAQDIVKKAQGLIPEAEQATNDGLETIDETTAFLVEAEERLNEMAPQIEADLKKAQNVASEANDVIKKVQNADIDFSLGEKIKDQMNEKINEATERIETTEAALEKLKELNSQPIEVDIGDLETEKENVNNDSEEDNEDNESNVDKDAVNKQVNEKLQENQSERDEKIDETLDKLATLKTDLDEVQESLGKIDAFLEDTEKDADKMLADLEEITSNTSERIDSFVKEYKETIEPTVLEQVAKAKSTLADARGILVDIQETIPEVEKILSRTGENLDEGKGTLESVLGEFPYVNDKVTQLANRIRDIQGEADINEIIELLRNDPEAERSFFEEPVKLHENKLFPIENYGTGMTPFYTVLAIWVGALLLISMLAADPNNPENFTARQMYFGRLFTFAAVGILQTLVVTLGDMFLLDVNVSSPFWFVVFGLLISFVFMSVVYIVVSVFSYVSISMAIVLLVQQIAVSGGTYPVALLPEFFQTINPFLLFTYAADLMREAVGGIVWERAARDIIFLSLVSVVFILFGALFKKTMNKRSHKLMKKSRETGLFH